jgi:putative mRNA 3-end processing factor
MPGSAQVRVEHRGEVAVVTGDYKLLDDGLSAPFEPVPCHTLITECTFGLPVYRFPDPTNTFLAIRDWWQECRDAGRSSVLFGYSLGKAQRLLHGLGEPLGPIYAHGAIQRGVERYKELGYSLPEVHPVTDDLAKKDLQGALAIAPPSALGSGWLKRFPKPSLGLASGWMRVRGNRRQRSVDRGFVLSDHADWNGLNEAVRACGPERVISSHGFNEPFAEWLREQGYEAHAERDLYESEEA